jgi:hypothetical protein
MVPLLTEAASANNVAEVGTSEEVLRAVLSLALQRSGTNSRPSRSTRAALDAAPGFCSRTLKRLQQGMQRASVAPSTDRMSIDAIAFRCLPASGFHRMPLLRVAAQKWSALPRI